MIAKTRLETIARTSLMTILLCIGLSLAAENFKLVTLKKTVNIHHEPSLKSEVLITVPFATILEIIGQKDKWYQVLYTIPENKQTITGYISHEAGEAVGPKDEAETEPEPEPAAVKTTKVKVIRNSVNIRKEPSTDAEIIRSALKDEIFEVSEKTGDWYKISLGKKDEKGGASGYLNQSVVLRIETASGEQARPAEVVTDIAPAKALKVRIIKNSVNIRKEPNLEAEIVREAFKGETFEVLEKKGEWYKIYLGKVDEKDGPVGYLNEIVVKRIEPPPEEPTPALEGESAQE